MAGRTTQAFDIEPKKRPKQGRSRITWTAILDATAQLLVESGYHGITTNHVAEKAGVSIGSVYEYFPGKDAIVAAVITRWAEAFMLGGAAALRRANTLPAFEGIRYSIDFAYNQLLQDQDLLRVIFLQVPFVYDMEPLHEFGANWFSILSDANQKAPPQYGKFPSLASAYLLNTLTLGTIFQLVLMPPRDIPVNDIFDMLTEKIIAWTAA